MLTAALFIMLGLAALTVGAELLVRGSAGLALRMGIPALVVGLTVVAFGTSSPELAVSVFAAARGDADIAVGNVVGSNIFNVLVILGLSAVIAPLAVQSRLIRVDVPLVIGASAGLWVLALDGEISRVESVLLISGLAGYLFWTVRSARADRGGELDRELTEQLGPGPAAEEKMTPAWLLAVFVVLGLGLCILGSRLFVGGAVTVARAWGVGELVIGLTVVAAGTSLPELATSALAAARGQRDIAVGNALGSNLFNILGVLGISGLIAPPAVAEQAIRLDLPVMLAAAVACVPVFISGARISRVEGGLFVALYAVYTLYLVLAAVGSPAAGPVGWVAVAVVTPAAVVGLVIGVVRGRRS